MEIALCILVLVLALAVAHLEIREFRRRKCANPVEAQTMRDHVELLYGKPGAWVHHSMRPEGHKDIAEALATPGMAVRRGGVIEEGRQ